MTICCTLRTAGLALLLLAGTPTWTIAQEKPAGPPTDTPATKTGKSARPDRPLSANAISDDESAAQTTQGLGAFGKVMPIGEKNIDVKIPSFRDGIPSSTVRATAMTRVDDENMTMESMDIRLYGDTHSKDVRIQLPTAAYHMPSQILSSDQRSRVSREDFKLEGDTMIFDTRTGQGKMSGNVRMVIYDADSLTPQKKEEQPAPPGSPASQPKSADTNSKADAPPAQAAPSPTTSPSSPPSNEKK